MKFDYDNQMAWINGMYIYDAVSAIVFNTWCRKEGEQCRNYTDKNYEFDGAKQEEELKKELEVLKTEHQGSLLLITARGTRREIMEKIQAKNPLFCEVLPLTLEEIFISETEVAGYEVKNLFQ